MYVCIKLFFPAVYGWVWHHGLLFVGGVQSQLPFHGAFIFLHLEHSQASVPSKFADLAQEHIFDNIELFQYVGIILYPLQSLHICSILFIFTANAYYMFPTRMLNLVLYYHSILQQSLI